MKKILMVLAVLFASLVPVVLTSTPAQAVTCTAEAMGREEYRQGHGGRTLLLEANLYYTRCVYANGDRYWQPDYIDASYKVVGGDKSCRPNPVGIATIDFYRFNFGAFGVWNPAPFEVNCQDDGYNYVRKYFMEPVQMIKFGASSPGGECWGTYIDEVVNRSEDDHWQLKTVCVQRI